VFCPAGCLTHRPGEKDGGMRIANRVLEIKKANDPSASCCAADREDVSGTPALGVDRRPGEKKEPGNDFKDPLTPHRKRGKKEGRPVVALYAGGWQRNGGPLRAFFWKSRTEDTESTREGSRPWGGRTKNVEGKPKPIFRKPGYIANSVREGGDFVRKWAKKRQLETGIKGRGN